MNNDIHAILGDNPSRKDIIAYWNPEDSKFWNRYGKKIGKQNLYVSTWALMLSFIVWTLWATVASKLNSIGFNFTDAELFSLAALPGLVGATGRLFYTYLPGLLGGKTTTFITTAILLFPIIGLGFALQDLSTTYSTFALLASCIGQGLTSPPLWQILAFSFLNQKKVRPSVSMPVSVISVYLLFT